MRYSIGAHDNVSTMGITTTHKLTLKIYDVRFSAIVPNISIDSRI